MNELYPIFIKMHQLKTVIIGAGEVASEKLHFLLKSSPNAQVTLIAPEAKAEVPQVLAKYPNVRWIKKRFAPADLQEATIVVVATNFPDLNIQVWEHAKAQGKLVNVADTPHLCDFYMGGIVTKGPLKIAISTNGQSPTMAKRLRQWLEEVIPDDITQLISSLRAYRSTLKNDFEYKVKELNRITQSLVE